MKKTSKMIMMVLVVMMFLCISVSASAETVLQFGATVNEQDSFQVAAEKFAELVNERTNGAYVIEIYPNGTLGGEADMLESMSMGMLDMGIITAGPFVNYSSMMGVMDMPFLFANNEEAYKILDGEIGHELLDTLEDAGLKGLAYAERGFRNITNSVKPVASAADVAGSDAVNLDALRCGAGEELAHALLAATVAAGYGRRPGEPHQRYLVLQDVGVQPEVLCS